jgi:1-acyl-sn-glycerol-3-phosphate acyltransferase
MSDSHTDSPESAKWDPVLTERIMGFLRPICKRYFRSEVRGLESFPPGPALVVANHSGGMWSTDVPVFAVAFYDHFGYERPIYTLVHDLMFTGPGPLAKFTEFVVRAGLIRASRDNATTALRAGGVVVVFPGGEYDVYRPTAAQNEIDFNGRTGYVKTALEAGVPIVPTVSIGAQESQFFLSRGTWLAERLQLKRRARSQILPISFGFPFGLSAMIPPNLPLHTKVVTQVLEPIDIAAEFGDDPDVGEVDAHVRGVMQTALDRLARDRRLPVLG